MNENEMVINTWFTEFKVETAVNVYLSYKQKRRNVWTRMRWTRLTSFTFSSDLQTTSKTAQRHYTPKQLMGDLFPNGFIRFAFLSMSVLKPHNCKIGVVH